MSVKLHNLSKIKGATHRKKRIGCGPGSGHGKTSCRGHKGGKSRSGYSINPLFEGGQMPMFRRFPHRGFNNYNFRTSFALVNVRDFNQLNSKEIDLQFLVDVGLVSDTKLSLKVLATGELTKAFHVKAHAFSETAKKKIEAAGGTVSIVK
jgi:large subunit ribosomal protein L15